jgi:3-oxoacyl-[acyl-carrier-protein] synthase III
MRIASVQHAVPSRPLTNEAVLRNIRAANTHLDAARLSELERSVASFLDAAGTQMRFELDDGERAIDLAVQTGRRALEQANVAPQDVDFVIYASVARGWIEPATACVLQAELGLTRATSFDVVDACAGWLRALQIAHGYLGSGTYRRGLIVNCECGLYRRYARWGIDGTDALQHQLATYTIGEAATSTVVTADDSSGEYYFDFKTFPAYATLCVLPLSSVGDFWPGDLDERVQPGQFFALSGQLLEAATKKVVQAFEQNPRLREKRYSICFGHGASEKVCQLISRRLGVDRIFFSTHPSYGNVVSASIPLGMSLAIEQGRLRRGDDVLVIVGSAGITVGFATFRF